MKKSRHNFYRRKDCIKKFCDDLKELVTEIINYKEKEMIPLTYKEIRFYEKQKGCNICKGYFCTNENNEKEFKLRHKVRDHCHYTVKFTGAAHSICNLRYKVAKKFQ